jgi:hypothetical protein
LDTASANGGYIPSPSGRGKSILLQNLQILEEETRIAHRSLHLVDHQYQLEHHIPGIDWDLPLLGQQNQTH